MNTCFASGMLYSSDWVSLSVRAHRLWAVYNDLWWREGHTGFVMVKWGHLKRSGSWGLCALCLLPPCHLRFVTALRSYTTHSLNLCGHTLTQMINIRIRVLLIKQRITGLSETQTLSVCCMSTHDAVKWNFFISRNGLVSVPDIFIYLSDVD